MEQLMLTIVLLISIKSFSQVTATTDHSITLTNAAVMTHAFRAVNSTQARGETFGKNYIISLLNQTDCVGMTVYFAQDTTGRLRVVIVGVKTVSGKNKDIYQGILAERGDCCAAGICCSITDNTNPLNTDQ